ncbi:coiled-coil-helix-coiled-coil-helix domain-containing protein 7 [Hyposmocoma kahamanoa]|uniref:coiled-coil-helix-coiled-coil-helix domain-containing protein 7 n=1 Tax=Hyposmocoma kahamanoa TaxID=1477025 RepID=UPI000E6D9914|nr:coiled-coil-helix-coiled-coil-helix domain-containing protein 7 [Hyposmocoma kahamanoa]
MPKLVNKDAERLNPCLKEQQMSYQCLDKNAFDQEKCQKYFDNYNTCKKFWGKIYSDRRARGIQPYLPNIEDRAKIKEDYMNSVKNQT